MCLIITGEAQKIRSTLLDTKGLLLDIFKTNPDGIGVMYATAQKLKIVKKLPNSFAQAVSFIERLPSDDRRLAIHFRWTTHGDTDLNNCHPYVVVENEVALMHNGVLSTGNSKDKTKSDTWHFINEYMAKSVAMAPGIVFDPGYAEMLRDFIGSTNRFVIMSRSGDVIILNKSQGLEHEGLWFSNSYAWTPSLLIANYHGWQGGNYRRGRQYNNGYDDDGYYFGGVYQGSSYTTGGGQSSGTKSGVQHNRPALPDGVTGRSETREETTTSGTSSTSTTVGSGGAAYTQADAQAEAEWDALVRRCHTEWQRSVEASTGGRRYTVRGGTASFKEGEEEAAAGASGEVLSLRAPGRAELIQALTDAAVDDFERWLSEFPQITLDLLFHLYKAGPTKWTSGDELAAYEKFMYNLCIKGDKEAREALADEVRRPTGSGAGKLAEVICYYLNWYAWPEVDAAAQSNRPPNPFPFPSEPPRSPQAINDPQPVLPQEQQERVVTDDSGDVSEAQLHQGEGGVEESSIYLG